ncbi:uncharacterized protein LOC112966099 isoform X2 [Apteryx rowi]|uniref:uncharacterized protein LOC112966099 isoform X2 n=1 Tax=Apteryx rowi TaxID=308060 RepID=UPI000E1CCEAD|nr:uncharacterized protein LOC112966099 isoform X2 [Apteryx rowi]
MALPPAPLPALCVYIGREEPEPQRRPSRAPSRRRRRPPCVPSAPRSGSPSMKGPSLETQMVEDETGSTSEELPSHLQEEPPEGGAPPVQIPRDLPLLTRFLPEVHTYHVTGERFAVATAFRGTEGLQTRCQQGPSTATGRDDLESDRRLVQYHPGSCGGHTGRSCLGGQQEPGAHQNSCDQCPRCWRWTGEGQRFGSDWRCWSRRQCSRQQSPFHCKEEGQS